MKPPTVTPTARAPSTARKPGTLPNLDTRLALTQLELAEAMHVSRDKIVEWTARHGLPCFREGKVIRYPIDQVRAWLAEQCEVRHGRGPGGRGESNP